MKLRPYEPEDIDFLYQIENDPELWDTSDNEALYSRYALKQYIAQATSIHVNGELRLIIEITNENGQNIPVGSIELTHYSALNARAEIGIALHKAYRGKGYGKRALQLIENLAVNRLRIHTLYAITQENNTNACNLFESVNYQLITILPEWQYRQGKYENMKLFAKYF